jgi:hypothetical protein
MGNATQTIVVKHRGNPGILAGVLGCLFGVLGILTLGVVFVPLAAFCSPVGLLRGLAGLSGSGIAVSLLAGVLTIMGFVFSPSLWLLAGGLLVASQAQEPTAPSTSMLAMTDEPSQPVIAALPGKRDLLRKSAVETGQEKSITLKKGETLGTILRDLGATPEEVKAIAAVLGPRGRDGNRQEGQKIRVLLSPVRGSQRLQPVRVMLVGETSVEAVVALSDRGTYVSDPNDCEVRGIEDETHDDPIRKAKLKEDNKRLEADWIREKQRREEAEKRKALAQ